jgi:hypothetical protein
MYRMKNAWGYFECLNQSENRRFIPPHFSTPPASEVTAFSISRSRRRIKDPYFEEKR